VAKNQQSLVEEWRPEALDDLLKLKDMSPQVADVCLAAIDDLTYRRKTGKALGTRDTSGDLTGLYRLKVDIPEVRPERYRILFELIDDSRLTIWAIGLRETRKVYRSARIRRTT
jgi:hypothetical protein